MEKWETSEDFGGRESCTESEDEVAGKWTDGKIERISRRSVTWQKDELLTEDSKGKKEPKRMIEIIEKVRKTGREVTSEVSWNWTVRHRSKISSSDDENEKWNCDERWMLQTKSSKVLITQALSAKLRSPSILLELSSTLGERLLSFRFQWTRICRRERRADRWHREKVVVYAFGVVVQASARSKRFNWWNYHWYSPNEF